MENRFMGGSINDGTPKWMVCNEKSFWNGWFGGTPILGNLQMMFAEARNARLLLALGKVKAEGGREVTQLVIVPSCVCVLWTSQPTTQQITRTTWSSIMDNYITCSTFVAEGYVYLYSLYMCMYVVKGIYIYIDAKLLGISIIWKHICWKSPPWARFIFKRN